MRFASLLSLVLLLAPAVFAQGLTTGSLSGIIKDKGTKTVLLGAVIQAVHTPTGAKYGTVARKGGRYTIKGMRVGGPYRITISYVGYKPAVIEGITIALGEEAEVNADLEQTQTVAQEVVVTAKTDKIFNPNKTGSGSTISEEEIAASPSINRSLSDIARVNPYASQTSSLGSDDGLQGVSVAGMNSRYNNIQIDGAVANDVFGLGEAGTAGSQANANTLSLDAIQELQVNVSPYDVRQSGFTGGLVNAITRGGTNKFSGSVFSYGRNQDLVGLSPDALRQSYAQFKDFQFGGRIGGPIIENELFFHVTGEVRLRNRPLELGVNNPNAVNNFAHDITELQRIVSIAKEKYGYDAGNADPFFSRNNTYNIIARLDWNIDDKNKLQFRHNYTNAFQDRNVQRTPTIFSLASQWNEFRSITNSSVIELNSLVSSNIANTLRISYNVTNDERVLQANPFPQVKIFMGGSDYVLLGPERSSQANSLDQTQIALTDDLSFFLGDHSLTIGTHNELYRFNNLFIQDYFGTYSFASIDAFQDSTPSFYQLSYANTDFTNGNLQPRAAWNMMQTSLYVEDEWKVLPDLRLTVGLRGDVPIYLEEPLENPTFKTRFDSLAQAYNNLPDSLKQFSTPIPAGLQTSRLPNPKFLFSPRVGFNYSVLGDKSFVVRGGSGIFTGRVPAVWLSNQFSNTGVDLYRLQYGTDNSTAAPIKINDSTYLKATLDPFNPLKPGSSATFLSNDKTTAVNIIDPNFKNPQVWRSTLAADIKLTDGISLTVEGMYGKLLNQVDYQNLNMKRSVGLAFSPVDQRPLYARNTSRTSVDSNSAKEFTQVLYITSRNEGYQYSAMAQVNMDESNPYIHGLNATIAYTYSAAFDLSDATSATALSNWQNTDTYNPNSARVGRSNFDVPHRFLANIGYKLNIFDKSAPTTFGIFYSGSSGRPHGFTYFGDLNGDGITHNDLVYIPKPEDFNTKILIVPSTDAAELRTAEQIWQQLMAFIDANSVLKAYQGKVLERNAMREPFVHQLDMRIAQKIPVNGKQQLEVTLDIQNLLNLLNSDWGIQRYVNFQSNNTVFVLRNSSNESPFDAQGRLKMSFAPPSGSNGIYTVDSYLSRWRMQLGLRFNF